MFLYAPPSLPVLGFDTETHLITDTVLAPPLVCATWATDATAGIFKRDGDGLPPGQSVSDLLTGWLERTILVGATIEFDMAVLAAMDPSLLPAILEAYERGRIRCITNRQKLFDIAAGEFRWRSMPDGTRERVNYTLADLGKRHLGIVLKKGEDTWRLRYAELENVPLAAWPFDARDYAIKDAQVARAGHEVQEQKRARIAAECNGLDILANENAQAAAAFALQLNSCWGLAVHPDKIAALHAGVLAEWEGIRDDLIEAGLVRLEMAKPPKTPRGTPKVAKYVRNIDAAKDRMRRVAWDNGYWALTGQPPREGYDPTSSLWSPEDGGLAWVPRSLKTTAKGGICLDEEACEDADDPDELLNDYARYTALSNVLGKDVKKLLAGRIHSRFDPLVGSGRTSSRGFNVQNLRRKGGTRECFVPRPGYVYCFIDLDMAELRAVGQLCIKLFGGSRLAEILNAGKDVHCWLAAEANGMTYDDFYALYKSDDEWAVDERTCYKSANFGLWGGMRAKRFQALMVKSMKRQLTEIRNDPDMPAEKRERKRAAILKQIAATTVERAEFIRQMWLATWPEARAYLARFEKGCAGGRTMTIEQLFSGRFRGALRYSEAANTGFQGLIADAIKAALWRVTRACYDPNGDGVRPGRSVLYGSRVVNMVHDEIMSEVPVSIAHECAMEIERIVIEEVSRYLPDVLPKASAYLAAFWSKKAFRMTDTGKPVTEGGRLIPWDWHRKAA